MTLIAGTILASITLFASCAGHSTPILGDAQLSTTVVNYGEFKKMGRGVANKSQLPPAPDKAPVIPTVPRGAKQLYIGLSHILISVPDGTTPMPDFGKAVAGDLKILSPEAGYELFNPNRKGAEIMYGPGIVLKPGDKGRVAVTREFKYGVDHYKNPQPSPEGKDRYLPRRQKKVETGVMTSIAARPTKNPKKVWIDIHPLVRELKGFETVTETLADDEERYTWEKPIFSESETLYKGTIENGSYIILGHRSAVRQTEDRVPVLSSIPLIGRAFRHKTVSRRTELIAVQVVVKEAK